MQPKRLSKFLMNSNELTAYQINGHRKKKLDTYLAAWDRREGWVGGEYRADLEMPLEGAAADLGLSTSTVHSQYCQAFKLITGQKYDAFLWFRLLGMFKISQHVGSDYPHISSQRPKSARQTRGGREVSEATFGVTTEEISSSDHGMLGAYNESDLLLDVQALVEEGASREDIVRRLEIPDHATQALDYLLDRMNS